MISKAFVLGGSTTSVLHCGPQARSCIDTEIRKYFMHAQNKVMESAEAFLTLDKALRNYTIFTKERPLEPKKQYCSVCKARTINRAIIHYTMG